MDGGNNTMMLHSVRLKYPNLFKPISTYHGEKYTCFLVLSPKDDTTKKALNRLMTEVMASAGIEPEGLRSCVTRAAYDHRLHPDTVVIRTSSTYRPFLIGPDDGPAEDGRHLYSGSLARAQILIWARVRDGVPYVGANALAVQHRRDMERWPEHVMKERT